MPFQPDHSEYNAELVRVAADAVYVHLHGGATRSIDVTADRDGLKSRTVIAWEPTLQTAATATFAQEAAYRRYLRLLGVMPETSWSVEERRLAAEKKVDRLATENPGQVDIAQARTDAETIMGDRHVWAATLDLAGRLTKGPLDGRGVATVLDRHPLRNVPGVRPARASRRSTPSVTAAVAAGAAAVPRFRSPAALRLRRPGGVRNTP